MDKNIIRDVDEPNNAIALEIEEARKSLGLRFDLSAAWSLNTIVPISVATTIDDLAVFIIHFSPSFLKFSWFIANKTYGVSPFVFFISLNAGFTAFSTSFHSIS